MPQTKNPMKLSICTTCMNRTHHLKQTLPHSLEACRNTMSKGWCELIIVNYNSQDGLDEFVWETLEEEVRKGWVRYFYTKEPRYFNAAHARNIGIHLSRGEKFCSVDADNYFDESFVKLLLSLPERTFATPLPNSSPKGGKRNDGIGGRLCCERERLVELHGYDEAVNYLEDIDLRSRLKKLGLQQTWLEEPSHLKCINHSDKARLQNFHPKLREDKRLLREKAIHHIGLYKTQLARNPDGWGIAKGWLDGIPYTTP